MPSVRSLALALLLGAAAPALPTAPLAAQSAPPAAAQPAPAWPVRTREHVDLWLHGFALLLDDTARVPLFRRGYAADARAARGRQNVATQLDAERDRLRQRLGATPRLALDAQFVPLAFASWDELRRAIELFVRAGGDPRRGGDQRTAGAIAFLAQTFPSGADREWLRVFAAALDDESRRWYHAHWLAEQRDRAAALAAADSVWTRVARPALQRYLNNTQQKDGELLLSLPLGGEGRTTGGGRSGIVAVGFPARATDAAEVAYVAAHELIGAVASTAVTDNITPAEARAGAGDRWASAAQVRGGLLLLQKTAPALAAGYARYYLRVAGQSDAAADPVAALAAAFPLPAAIADAIARQIDVTLGGI